MTDALATQEQQGLNVQALISQALEKGTDPATLERLMALGERVYAFRAKQAYDGAMAIFHRDCPPIYKTATGRVGTAVTRYAPLDEIMDKARPVLSANGLALSWRSPRNETGKVVVVARVTHALGHYEESGEVVVPIVAAGAATPAQQVGLAMSYAERYSARNILGIAPEPGEDTDGKAPGNGHEEQAGQVGVPAGGDPGQQQAGQVTTISDPQVKRFWAIARAGGWGEEKIKALLTKHGIESTAAIPTGIYESLCNAMKGGTGA